MTVIETEILKYIGRWVKTNEELVYDATPADIQAENADIFVNGEYYYAAIRKVPMSANVNVTRIEDNKVIKLHTDKTIQEAVWLDNGSKVELTDGQTFKAQAFLYGTNDYGHGDAKLGTFEDRDDYTFYGAFHNLVAYMVGAFPKDKLCFILPIPRFDQDNLYGDGSKDEPIAPMSAYVEAEKEVLAYYGVDYIDLSDKFYIPTTQRDDGNLYADGLHPNPKGHRVLANCLIEYLEKAVFPRHLRLGQK